MLVLSNLVLPSNVRIITSIESFKQMARRALLPRPPRCLIDEGGDFPLINLLSEFDKYMLAHTHTDPLPLPDGSLPQREAKEPKKDTEREAIRK